MLIAPIALAAALPAAFEDLDQIDARIAVLGAANPVDRRLKLSRCPRPVEIGEIGGNAVAVRCPALGWRILVPLQATAQREAEPDIRKGDVVDLSVDGDGFSVSASATALEDGRAGRAIRLRTSAENPPLTASVLGAGRARIN